MSIRLIKEEIKNKISKVRKKEYFKKIIEIIKDNRETSSINVEMYTYIDLNELSKKTLTDIYNYINNIDITQLSSEDIIFTSTELPDDEDKNINPKNKYSKREKLLIDKKK